MHTPSTTREDFINKNLGIAMARAKSKKIKDLQRLLTYESESDKRFFKTMKELDTARAIVKDLNPRDPVTGEVVFIEKNRDKIESKLLASKFCYEKVNQIQVNSPLVKHIRVEQYPIWEEITCKTINKVLAHPDSEVLNSAFEPCWWR
ncbi:MAG: hypothetical protein WC325_10630 [Candidatus Bathyarchaeia archaeon]